MKTRVLLSEDRNRHHLTPSFDSARVASKHINELDGLRGVLAVWVALSHVLCLTGFTSLNLPGGLNRFWPDFIYAGPAVRAFIILSGFAIASLIAGRRNTYGQFIAGRAFRIYPTYLCCLGIAVVTLPLLPNLLSVAPWNTDYFDTLRRVSTNEHRSFVSHLIAHLSLLHGAVPKSVLEDSAGSILPPAWSISLEWQFYLVAPLVLRLVRMPLGVLLVCLLSGGGLAYTAAWRNPQVAFLLPNLPFFLLGIASYYVFRAHQRNPLIWFTRLPVIICVGCFGLVFSRWHALALLIWAIAFGSHFAPELSFVRRALLSPALQWLGRISYPLYLVHWPMIILLLAALLKAAPDCPPGTAALFLLAIGGPVIIVSASLLHRYVEQPMSLYGRRVTSPSVLRDKFV